MISPTSYHYLSLNHLHWPSPQSCHKIFFPTLFAIAFSKMGMALFFLSPGSNFIMYPVFLPESNTYMMWSSYTSEEHATNKSLYTKNMGVRVGSLSTQLLAKKQVGLHQNFKHITKFSENYLLMGSSTSPKNVALGNTPSSCIRLKHCSIMKMSS